MARAAEKRERGRLQRPRRGRLSPPGSLASGRRNAKMAERRLSPAPSPRFANDLVFPGHAMLRISLAALLFVVPVAPLTAGPVLDSMDVLRFRAPKEKARATLVPGK